MDGPPPPPPPPPPHGENPHTTEGEYRKASDMPPGNYDIFIVPPHSAGSGFLYLPSLQCNRNSFIAGAASTLVLVFIWSAIAPVVKTWYVAAATRNNNVGMIVVALGVGVAGWAFGMSQSGQSNGSGNGGKRFGDYGSFGGFGGSGGENSQGQSSGANYGNGPGRQQHGGASHGGPGQQQQRQQGGNYGGGPNQGNQYAGNQHGPGPESGAPPKSDHNNHGPNGAEWERAREETKRKEELRRKMEEFKRKREAEAKEKERKREREAMEKELKERREQLEREMAAAREKAEREARERAEKEAREVRERAEREAAEARAKLEKAAAEAKEKAAKEAAEKAAAEKVAAQKEAMAKFAALKEAAAKRYAEKKAQEQKKETPPPKAGSTTSAPRTPSPKKPPFPTAKTTVDDDAYSFRPYDRPRRPYGQASGSSAYSESSYAPSQSTARTTPPPSHRGTYSTKDPDKIVILGVYQFTNAFMKTPVAQLVSGQGMVTDGLVLRMTTEGLFVDDDLRGVGQREWDVKAWTLKLAEVWCPQMGTPQGSKQPASANPFSFRRSGSAHSVPTNEESDAFTANLLKVCKNTCRLATPTTGVEFRGLHVLRASLRDQEGKRYVFVLQDTEAWKVSIGLQRLRGGALVRALGVSAMPAPDCKTILSNLGYT